VIDALERDMGASLATKQDVLLLRQELDLLRKEVDHFRQDVARDCLELFHLKLRPGALVAADNMLFPLNTRPAAIAYQARVRTKPDLDSVLLPIGSGVELSRKHEQALSLL
jgi:predicted O-methyltransferase YrrM